MKILFFTPFSRKNGAETALYNIIRNSQHIDAAIASGQKGELLDLVPKQIPIRIYNRYGIYHRVRFKVHRRLTGENYVFRSLAKEFKGHIWYVNTILQAEVIRHARKFGVPCVVHLHEMEQTFAALREDEAHDLVTYPDLIIACSECVASRLRTLGRAENLEVLHEPVVIDDINSSEEGREKVRNLLGVSPNTFVWAMAGYIDPNKNASLFVDLARYMLDKEIDSHFVWIGGSGTGYETYVRNKSVEIRVANRVTWAGVRDEDYYDYLNAADGFVLTSTRDSFPLVMVEAAALCKPIVAFNSGGVSEFVKPGMGRVVDSWNLADLADAMISVMTGKIEIDRNSLRRQAEKLDVSVQVERWEGILRKYVGGDGHPNRGQFSDLPH